MNISIAGKGVDIGDALKSHIDKKVNEICSKYFENSLEAHLVVSKESILFKVDVSVHAGRGLTLRSHGQADQPYVAVDNALDKLSHRLARQKNRLRDHHKKQDQHLDAVTVPHYVLSSSEETQEQTNHNNPLIIAEMTTQLPTLTVSEAVMYMDLADLEALMFKNRSYNRLNVVYRRQDGNIGWIDPTA